MPREVLTQKTAYNYEDAANKRFCSARSPNFNAGRNTRRGRDFKWQSPAIYEQLPRYNNRPKKALPRFAFMDLLKELKCDIDDKYEEELVAISFARKRGLLEDLPSCCCGGAQTLQRYHTHHAFLRCRKCRKRCSPYKGTILQDSHLGLNMQSKGFLSTRIGIFLAVLYYWSRSFTVTQTAVETGLSSPTVSVWFRLIRQAVVDHVDSDPMFAEPIGGCGSIVEIDEAMLYHAKFNKGRQPEGLVMSQQDEIFELPIQEQCKLPVDAHARNSEQCSTRNLSSLRSQPHIYYGESEDEFADLIGIAVDDAAVNKQEKIDSQVWVFGAVDYFSGRCKFKLVENRKAESLIPIIEDWISPGSTIWSDGWRSYRCVEHHPSYFFDWVNHKERYVNATGVNTNLIERLWSAVRAVIPPTTRAKEKEAYLKEAWFRLMYRSEDVFFVMMKIMGSTKYETS